VASAAAPSLISRAATDAAAEAAPPAQPPQPGGQQPPSADIDALARQVYDVLKQRLATERRRMG